MGDSTRSCADVLLTLSENPDPFTHGCGETLLRRAFATRTSCSEPPFIIQPRKAASRTTPALRKWNDSTERMEKRSAVGIRTGRSDFPYKPGVSLGTRTTSTAGRSQRNLGRVDETMDNGKKTDTGFIRRPVHEPARLNCYSFGSVQGLIGWKK